MRFDRLRFLVLALVAALPVLACANGAPPRYVSTLHGPQTTVRIWLDPKSGLPPKDTLAGCNYWNETDVLCAMVTNIVEADVVIMADTHPCSPNGKGSFDIAFASPARVISVRLDCYYDTSRTSGFDAEQYRSVIAHEVGHEIGIWDHVPLACATKEERELPETQRRCGPAIMNPSYDPKIAYLTPADAVAFAQRDREHTVVPPRSVIERRGCVMSAPTK